jgi:saccharopine dehydrogenase-like NADP-dependent oxidoreductase
MKRILVLGAGASAPYLIHHLLEVSTKHDWFVTVGDRDLAAAETRVNGHERGKALEFDVNDVELLASQITRSDLVVNLLAPRFQPDIARECVRIGRSMVSASYRDDRICDFDDDASRKGVLLLTEVGLDPGIDHMTAMSLIDRIKAEGGEVVSFESYGGGLPAPDTLDNPFGYVITCNPRNVVMAGERGAEFLDRGQIRMVPFHNLFQNSWPVKVPGVGDMEAYPNRSSLSYRTLYGIEEVESMIRGTIRYPGFCETWTQIARLGLPNETLQIPDLGDRTWAELVEMFVPTQVAGDNLALRVANFLRISPTGQIMKNLTWLGLFAEEKTGVTGNTAASAMVELLNRKLRLAADARDMVILQHDFLIRYPAENSRHEQIVATLVAYGEPGGFTAMAKTVGMPAAIAAELILTDQIPLTGCQIPTHPAIYKPILAELEKEGLRMTETVEPKD